MLRTLLPWIASTVFLVRLLPQPVRLARTGRADGVSPLSALNAVIADGAWLAYGLSAGLVAVWGVSIVALVPGLWAVALLRRRTRWSDAVVSLLWVTALVVAYAVGVFVAALGAAVVVTHGPQAWRALREGDLSGISRATWYVALVDGATWGAYGLVIGDLALQIYAIVLLSCALIVLIRVHRSAVSPSAAPSGAVEPAGR